MGNLPTSVNLRAKFDKFGLPVRFQGKRGTCSVFTVVGALEYALAISQGNGTVLSVEFLNWASHKVANRKADGGFFSELWNGYVEYGICAESDMPYLAEFNPDLQPSEQVLQKAKQTLSTKLEMHWIKEWDVNTGLTDEQFVEIKRTIADQFPVCGGFRWPKDAKWENDMLKMCPPSEVFDGHSVLLEGYEDDLKQPGGGIFAIRNSARNDRIGYMSYEYVKMYMNDALWIKPSELA